MMFGSGTVRVGRDEHQRARRVNKFDRSLAQKNGPRCAGQVQAFPREVWRG
jgi:hypothetical protein